MNDVMINKAASIQRCVQRARDERAAAHDFELLVASGRLEAELGRRLRRMVGFRNTVVHQYQEVDIDIVEAVIDRGLEDLLTFTEGMLERSD